MKKQNTKTVSTLEILSNKNLEELRSFAKKIIPYPPFRIFNEFSMDLGIYFWLTS